MTSLPPPSGDMEKLLERYLGYNEHPTNVTGCTPGNPCEYHAEKASVLAYIRSLEADHQARKEREEKVRELLYEIRNDGCSDGGCTCCNGAARKAQKALSLLSK